jgi:hypothetical protein
MCGCRRVSSGTKITSMDLVVNTTRRGGEGERVRCADAGGYPAGPR